MRWRAVARRYVPAEARLRVRLAQRSLHDRRAGTKFASARRDPAQFPHAWATYERPLIDYPGQDEWSRGKRQNFSLMAGATTGLVLRQGEVYSAWRIAGRPTSSRGYLPGAGLKDGKFVSDVGGGVCLFSTVIYNLALLSGMTILERHAHSQDSYGEQRYFELARDAAIEYGYLDLRFSNPHPQPLLLVAGLDASRVYGEVRGGEACPFHVEIRHDEPTVLPFGTRFIDDSSSPAGAEAVTRKGLPGLTVEATRTFVFRDGTIRTEKMPATTHFPVDAVVRRGPGG